MKLILVQSKDPRWPVGLPSDTHLLPMKTPVITIGGRSGMIFEGEIPQTYCFVPEDCIHREPDGVCVAEGDYMRSRWDVRNMRFNDAGTGEHLFPDPLRPVVDLNGPPVKNFIRRIELVGVR